MFVDVLRYNAQLPAKISYRFCRCLKNEIDLVDVVGINDAYVMVRNKSGETS